MKAGRLEDPALSVHLRIGYDVRKVQHGYLRDDESLDYATLLAWTNDRHDPARRRIASAPLRRPVRRVRVCAAQYELRPITGFEELEQQVRFFVATAASYHCHYLVLPELFTAQLFSAFAPELPSREAIARLAALAPRYEALMRQLAQESGLHLVAGSTPVRRKGEIYNVAHLITPSGGVFTQDKLHVTPNEREAYGISPGTGITVFDTGFAKCALVVCYDIDLINYGNAVVCTPSDFLFPMDGIAGVADTNAETVVIADLDLDALHAAREVGSVRPLRDRRPDLYTLAPKVEVQRVRTTSVDRPP